MKIERRARWDRLWLPVDIVLRKIETLYWHTRGFEVIECFGDSHVKVMRRLNWMYPELSVRFRTISVMGATAYGVVNYNSTTSAREIYEKRLSNLPKNHKVLVMLGEIDGSFLIWRLAQRKGLSVDDILNKTIEHYSDFLAYIKNMNKDLYVVSASLPTLNDGMEKAANLAVRGTISASKRDRTEMTLKFNSFVKDRCRIIGAKFIDLDPLSIDENSGLVQERLINAIVPDNHYDERVYADMIRKKLLDMQVVMERF